MAKNYKHIAVEIPPGKPQIKYFEEGGYWTSRGDVLRCRVGWGEEVNQATVWIDEKEFTMEELGRLLSVYEGWGMRLIFLPEDETHVNPPIELKEPNDENREGSLALSLTLCPENEH